MQRLHVRGVILNKALLVWCRGTAVCRIPASSRSRAPRPGRVPLASSFHVSAATAAGHNKWSKVKHVKFAADKAKSDSYAKLSVEISSSVREAGDNTDTNLRLSSALSRARKLGVPKATVERAIATGRGEVKGADAAESVLYEGRGPGGYLLLIEALTNNRLRTRPELRTLLTKHNGLLGEPGSSSFMFDHKGVVTVPKDSGSDFDPMEVAIEVGAEDVKCEEDEDDTLCYWFVCDPQQLKVVTEAVKSKGLTVSSSTLEYLPKSTVTLEELSYNKAATLMHLLQQHQDVIRVYSNFKLNDNTIDV